MVAPVEWFSYKSEDVRLPEEQKCSEAIEIVGEQKCPECAMASKKKKCLKDTTITE